MSSQSVGKIYPFTHPRAVVPEPSRAVEMTARIGLSAKGVVYLIAGCCAASFALGFELPSSDLWLAMIAVGLMPYAVWRVTQAALDPDCRLRRHQLHQSRARVAARRIGYAVNGFVHAALALVAMRLVLGIREPAIVPIPLAPPLVTALGLLLVGAGVREWYGAHRREFLYEYDAAKMTAADRELVLRAGLRGHFARGIAFVVAGGLLLRAALAQEPLIAVVTPSYGHVLVGIVAVGLVVYGWSCFAEARDRRFLRRAY
jgi:hypothetical protein